MNRWTKTSENIQLYHGDYRCGLRQVQADLIFTSPPYNIGSKSPRLDGYRKLGQYDPKSYGAIRDYPDTLPESTYQAQQVNLFLWAAAHLTPHGILVYNHKPRRKEGRMIHPAEWFGRLQIRRKLTLMEEIIWDRGSTHNHCDKLMWPTTERLYVFRRVDGIYPLKNHEALAYRKDLWEIPRAPGNGHNAPFPLELALAVIEAWSPPGALVCDPYMGSGTTAEAARTLGRRFAGAEILEKYYRQATQRLQTTGQEVA